MPDLPLYKRCVLFGALAWLALLPARAPDALLPVCQLQGSGFDSPYTGLPVRVRGVVYADQDQASPAGFYLQQTGCDARPETSDGIFVRLSAPGEIVQPADRVEVSGIVQEYYGQTELLAGPAAVQRLSDGSPLPPPVELDPPFDAGQARLYFERLEGMRVSLSDGRVVGPTDSRGRTWLARAGLGLAHILSGDPDRTGAVICTGGGMQRLQAAAAGDRAAGLSGPLSYDFGVYCLEPFEAFVHTPAVPATILPPPGAPRLATFNLGGLFDTTDDPLTDDEVLSYTEYRRRVRKLAQALHGALGEPAIVVVQEVESLPVLLELVSPPYILAVYRAVLVEGPDRRGIDTGLLYRPDQVRLLEAWTRQACTGLQDGLEPDGNGDLQNPANTLTCDRDGDGVLDGSRLFSRPPLAARLQLSADGGTGQELWLIANHFKSRKEDTPWNAYTAARRAEQGAFVAGLAREILAAHPGAALAVLGDLNDLPGSPALRPLAALGFEDLLNRLGPAQQYTYIYQGVAQPLDHILLRPSTGLIAGLPAAARINADYPYSLAANTASLLRASDHDPLSVVITPPACRLALPLVFK
ncbi:MAG: endonuclease/exonuclease/phosphatase family protein [Chloroflexota bacterium]